MFEQSFCSRYRFQILETQREMFAVEELQRLVWPGDDTEVVPVHMLMAVVHNGGMIVGAYDLGVHPEHEAGAVIESEDDLEWGNIPSNAPLVGFVFGFPGLSPAPDGPQPKFCSHMMGVHPDHRDQGIGFILKRAQWQIVRRLGLDRITWTYDPLLSRNAHLNVARLGAVCNTYIRNVYGELRDGLNVGLATDRFQLDWWVNSPRVNRRLSKKSRRRLDLAHFLAAEAIIVNQTQVDDDGLPYPGLAAAWQEGGLEARKSPLVLVEIPAHFQALKRKNMPLAQEWRDHTRALFETLFAGGYLVTDFIYLPATHARSFYVLSHGESTF